jgi:hypothetical protein
MVETLSFTPFRESNLSARACCLDCRKSAATMAMGLIASGWLLTSRHGTDLGRPTRSPPSAHRSMVPGVCVEGGAVPCLAYPREANSADSDLGESPWEATAQISPVVANVAVRFRSTGVRREAQPKRTFLE